MVSPTLVSATFLIVATKKPTSPAVSSAISTGLGSHDTHALDVEGLAVREELDLHALAQLAVDDAGEDDDAFVGIEPGIEDERLQRGFGVALAAGGSRLTTASRMASTLRPVLAETAIASVAGRPTVFSIISLVRSMSALGRSILLMMGRISRPFEMAR